EREEAGEIVAGDIAVLDGELNTVAAGRRAEEDAGNVVLHPHAVEHHPGAARSLGRNEDAGAVRAASTVLDEGVGHEQPGLGRRGLEDDSIEIFTQDAILDDQRRAVGESDAASQDYSQISD